MQEASGPPGYRLAKALLTRPVHRAFDIQVEGSDRVPEGPSILAANHRSFMDSVFLGAAVDRPVSFMAKAGLAPEPPGCSQTRRAAPKPPPGEPPKPPRKG